MKKIPCLFERDFTNPRRPILLDRVTPGCERIAAGDGVATVKWDGTACLVKDGRLYARYDAKAGKTPPEGSIPSQEAPDLRAWRDGADTSLEDGTYELCGPHFQGNPAKLEQDTFIKHGAQELEAVPRTFEGLRVWFTERRLWEGIVFWLDGAPFCKIRRDDYGLPWPPGE